MDLGLLVRLSNRGVAFQPVTPSKSDTPGVDTLYSLLQLLDDLLFSLLGGRKLPTLLSLSRVARDRFTSKYSESDWIVRCGGNAYSIRKPDSVSRTAETVPRTTDVTASSSVKETIVLILVELSRSS